MMQAECGFFAADQKNILKMSLLTISQSSGCISATSSHLKFDFSSYIH